MTAAFEPQPVPVPSSRPAPDPRPDGQDKYLSHTSRLHYRLPVADAWWLRAPTRRTRIIPVLLLSGRGFVKTTRFKRPVYLGDPVNIVKIFNDKEVDELFVLDISATPSARGPNFDLLRDLASECFVPLSYGGGVRSVEDVQRLTSLGFEKVCLNTQFVENPNLVRQLVQQFGSSTIVVSIDAREKLFGGYEVCVRSGSKSAGRTPVELAQLAADCGAGELLVNSIHRDGTMQGYDIKLLRQVTSAVSIPVVACGGAGTLDHLRAAASDAGAAAVAAGSLFVFHGRHRAVLINMPTSDELAKAGIP